MFSGELEKKCLLILLDGGNCIHDIDMWQTLAQRVSGTFSTVIFSPLTSGPTIGLSGLHDGAAHS